MRVWTELCPPELPPLLGSLLDHVPPVLNVELPVAVPLLPVLCVFREHNTLLAKFQMIPAAVFFACSRNRVFVLPVSVFQVWVFLVLTAK